MTRRLILSLLFATLSGVGTQAQNVASFNFANTNTTNNTLPNGTGADQVQVTTAAGWTVTSDLGLGSGLTGVASPGTYGGNGWSNGGSPNNGAGNYLSFSLTNGTGGSVDLASLSIRANATNGNTLTFEVQNSLSGFSNTTGTGPIWNFTSDGTPQDRTFTFGSPLSVGNGVAVEFRLLGYSSSTGNNYWLDSTGGGAAGLSVTPVPEPATVLGLSAFGLVMFRRIRRRS